MKYFSKFPSVCLVFAIMGLLVSAPVMADSASEEDDINLKIRAAEHSVRAGELERAVELYEQIALSDVETASRRLGPLYARLGLHEKALSFYRAVLKVRPRDHWAWYCYAYALRSKGDYLEAKKAYLKVLEIAPDDVNALYGLAWAYRALDRHEEALRYFRAYVQKEKRREAAGWKTRAEKESVALEKLLRKADKAREGEEKKPDVTDDVKDDAALVLKDAVEAERSGEHEKAESLYAEALIKHSRDARVHRSYIEYLLRFNKLQEAETAIRLSLRNVAGFAWGRWQLVRLLLKAGKEDKVEFHVRILAADHPEDPGGLCAQAHLLLSKGENVEADALFDRGMKIARAAGKRKAWEFCREGGVKTASLLGKPEPRDVFVVTREKKVSPAVDHKDKKDERDTGEPTDVEILKKVKKTEVTTPVDVQIKSAGPVPDEIRKGREKFDRGDYAAAGRIADAYVAKDAGSYHAWVLAAEAAFRQGNLERAQTAAGKALGIFPLGAAAYRIMGLVDLKYRRRTSAKDNFEKFINLAPDDGLELKHVDFIKGLLKNLR